MKFSPKIRRTVLIFGVGGLVFTLLALIVTLYRSESRQQTLQELDHAITLTKKMLDEEEEKALSLSLLLSQERPLLEAYKAHRRKELFDLIRSKIERLERLQGYHVDIQIHDARVRSYLRSWDYNASGEELSSFRKGIVQVRRTHRPLVSVEVGKRLNIKAISPMIDEGEYLGSIEVIEGFNDLERKMREAGYRLLILLNRRYLSVAWKLKSHPRIAGDFVLVNPGYVSEAVEALNSSFPPDPGDYGYFSGEGYAFGYFRLRDFEGRKLGYFVVALTSARSPLPAEEFHPVPVVTGDHERVRIR